jgi:hypothetical protein
VDLEFSSFNILDRMVEAVRLVQDRLLRSVDALSRAKIPHAICGGNAAMAWTGSVSPSAVRYTPKVEHLIRRSELRAAINALATVGFIHHSTSGNAVFVDGRKGEFIAGFSFTLQRRRRSRLACSPILTLTKLRFAKTVIDD